MEMIVYKNQVVVCDDCKSENLKYHYRVKPRISMSDWGKDTDGGSFGSSYRDVEREVDELECKDCGHCVAKKVIKSE